MGLYINGIGNSKEEKIEWLAEHGFFKRIQKGDEEITFDYGHHADKGRRLVCAVDNGAFIAVGVAFDEQELNRFIRPDGRYKAWFTLDLGTIKKACPDWEDYIGEEI